MCNLQDISFILCVVCSVFIRFFASKVFSVGSRSFLRFLNSYPTINLVAKQECTGMYKSE